MNRWTGMGRLTADPEVKFTENSGVCVTTFTLACNYASRGEQHADFIRCEAWDRNAEIIAQYCHKGDRILVDTGRIRTRSYEKDGKKSFFTCVVVNRFEFVEKKKDVENDALVDKGPTDAMPDTYKAEWQPAEDEIPF